MEAPVPYVGSKKNWVNELTAIANAMPKNAKILDAYGGSGLCAHVFKSTRPDLQVWCNDADEFIKTILPKSEAIRAWHGRWVGKDREVYEPGGPAEKALAKIVGAEKASNVLASMVNLSTSDSPLRKTLQPPPDGYLKGVKLLAKMWGPGNEIPLHFDFLILDPPYNTVKALDSTAYGTRRDDPPLSLWAAQKAFAGKTPAICWGRDGWLVDYPSGKVIGEKRCNRGHATEWCKANNPALDKYHLDRVLKDLR